MSDKNIVQFLINENTLNIESRINANDMDQIVKLLKTGMKLHTLKIQLSCVSFDIISTLLESLSTNNEINKLELSCGFNNHITLDIMHQVIKLVQLNPSLNELYLHNNCFDSEAIVAMTNMLRTNTSIKTLLLHHNDIDEIGTTEIFNSLLTTTTLQHLCLAVNKIDSNGTNELVKLLKNNKTLKKLFLGSNNIDSGNIVSIIAALQSNTCLDTLSLDGNNITPEAILEIARLLQSNTYLQILSLTNNNIDFDLADKIAEIFENNYTLICIDVGLMNKRINNITERNSKLLSGSFMENNSIGIVSY